MRIFVAVLCLFTVCRMLSAEDGVLRNRKPLEMPALTGLSAPALSQFENASSQEAELKKKLYTFRLAGKDVDPALVRQLAECEKKKKSSETAIGVLSQLSELQKEFTQLEADSAGLWRTKLPEKFQNLASSAAVAIEAMLQANSSGRASDVIRQSGKVEGLLMQMEFCLEDAEMEIDMEESREELSLFVESLEVRRSMEDFDRACENFRAVRAKLLQEQLRVLEAETDQQISDMKRASSESSLDLLESDAKKARQQMETVMKSAWEAAEKEEEKAEAIEEDDEE